MWEYIQDKVGSSHKNILNECSPLKINNKARMFSITNSAKKII